LGFYDNLNESIKDINEWLEVYKVQIEELNEYISTFGKSFDTYVTIDEFGTSISIRGFIFE
jgi:predicted methyltransferase